VAHHSKDFRSDPPAMAYHILFRGPNFKKACRLVIGLSAGEGYCDEYFTPILPQPPNSIFTPICGLFLNFCVFAEL